MFQLEDLMGHRLKGLYYEAQLKLAPNPEKVGFFEVEKIVSQRKVNGKKYVLVSYKNYPSKFNQWVLEDNIKRI